MTCSANTSSINSGHRHSTAVAYRRNFQHTDQAPRIRDTATMRTVYRVDRPPSYPDSASGKSVGIASVHLAGRDVEHVVQRSRV